MLRAKLCRTPHERMWTDVCRRQSLIARGGRSRTRIAINNLLLGLGFLLAMAAIFS